jgi:hypothetical protein
MALCSGRVRPCLLALAVAALLGAAAPAGAGAGTGLFVGVDEDAFLWGAPQPAASIARALGLKAIHITAPWHPGESSVPAGYEQALSSGLVEAWGLRPVVSVYGSAADAPRTDEARAQYCDYVGDLLRRNPTVNDVVIWNDPNDIAFWSPQFNPDGSSAAPADYEALLARCWDTLHAVRPSVNVIALSVSRAVGVTAPGVIAFAINWHSPVSWYQKLGAAYQASGRTAPIFDTVGHIPHGSGSAERPWTQHTSGVIGEGDYDLLVKALTDAFGGTGQPVPGQGSMSIWYLTAGYQTSPDAGKASLYQGRELDSSPLPAWSAAEASDTGTGRAPDQATQIEDALRVAYCQPYVGAYFNFHLADEASLAGWQSGVLWADWSPKPSYAALKRAVASVNTKAIDCATFSRTGAPPRLAPLPAPPPALHVLNLHSASVSSFSATVGWRTTISGSIRVRYGTPASGPVLWAAVSGQQATLPGLSPGTSYRVWLTAVSDDGQRAQAVLDLETPAFRADAAPAVRAFSGALLVDGQPFFPMIVWSQCPSGYAADLAAGINLFAENPCTGLQGQLNALGGQAFSAAVTDEPGGTGPGLIGYFYPDEPDGRGLNGASLPAAPPGAPSLSFLTLTNHFYSGAAQLPGEQDVYPRLIARADVVGFDLYPLQEWCYPDRLGDVFSAQQELVRLAAPRPTFQWIEAAEWKCPGGATAVTPATVRAESWLAIAGGANALGFFPATFSPEIGAAIAGVSRDVAKLTPALVSPSLPASADVPLVKVGARSYDGATYVIAVNAGYTATGATITVPGLNGRTLDVMNEGRRLGAVGSSFSDTFAPLAVHVYVAPPADS